jgi:hypothetical protein
MNWAGTRNLAVYYLVKHSVLMTVIKRGATLFQGIGMKLKMDEWRR